MSFCNQKTLIAIMGILLSLMLASRDGYSQVQVDGDWKRNLLSFGSFLAPADLASVPFRGKDSVVWKFESENLTLVIDLGLYSGNPNVDKEEEGYAEKEITIDGKRATLVNFKYRTARSDRFDYISAIYFPKMGSKYSKLALVAKCKTVNEQRIAERIFRSIKFKT